MTEALYDAAVEVGQLLVKGHCSSRCGWQLRGGPITAELLGPPRGAVFAAGSRLDTEVRQTAVWPSICAGDARSQSEPEQCVLQGLV